MHAAHVMVKLDLVLELETSLLNNVSNECAMPLSNSFELFPKLPLRNESPMVPR